MYYLSFLEVFELFETGIEYVYYVLDYLKPV